MNYDILLYGWFFRPHLNNCIIKNTNNRVKVYLDKYKTSLPYNQQFKQDVRPLVCDAWNKLIDC